MSAATKTCPGFAEYEHTITQKAACARAVAAMKAAFRFELRIILNLGFKK